MEQFELQIVLLAGVDLHAWQHEFHSLVERHDLEDVLKVQHELGSLVEDLVVVLGRLIQARVEDISQEPQVLNKCELRRLYIQVK